MHAGKQNHANKRTLFRNLDEYKDPAFVKDFIWENGFVKEYKALWRSPERYCKNWKFDRVIMTTNRFHVMVPIVVDAIDGEETRNLSFFLLLLKNCGLNPISVDALKQKKEKGLMRCHCATYLKLAWCTHACAFAFHHGVITTYPKTMNPIATIARKSGRPENSVKGGGLGYK
jgi:hypothetical protein